MRLFGSPVVVNLNNPFLKIFNRGSTLHVIANAATRNTIFLNIANLIIYSIYAVESIAPHFPIWLVDLIRLYSTIMTRLLGNPSKKFFIQIPKYVSIFRIKFCGPIQGTKCSFAQGQAFPTSTTYSKSFFQRRRQSCNFFSTITDTKKSSSISSKIWKSFDNNKFSKSLTNNIYIPTRFTSAIILCLFSKLRTSYNNRISAIAPTNPSSSNPIQNRCLFYNQEFSISISNFINCFSSRNHSNLLKGDSLQPAMLLFRQHLSKSLGVMNKKFAYRLGCLNIGIIPQCA